MSHYTSNNDYQQQSQQGYQPQHSQQGYQPQNSQQGYQPEHSQQGYQPEHSQQGYQPQHSQQGYQPQPSQEYQQQPSQQYQDQQHQQYQPQQSQQYDDSIHPEHQHRSRGAELFPEDYDDYYDGDDDGGGRGRHKVVLTEEELEMQKQKRLDRFEMIDGTRQCLVTAWSVMVTCILLGDLTTDAWLMIIYGLQGHTLFLGLSIIFYVVTSFTIAAMYAIQLPGGGTKNADNDQTHKKAAKSVRLMAGCWLCNVPLQLGVIVHRIVYAMRRCTHCCESENRRGPARTEWTLAKLKLVHSTVQSAPMLTANLLHLLIYPGLHWMQWISASFSFISLVVGVTTYENCRKSRSKMAPVSLGQSLLVLIYKSAMCGARIAAIANFTYYYGALVVLVLVPHYCLLFLAFSFVYSKMYRVSYAKIASHCFYCLIDYIPLNNDYRPEGEVILYYVLVVFENLVMVLLPIKKRPTENINVTMYAPGTLYYNSLLVVVLAGSFGGLVIATIYYFLFHKSRHNIRKSHLGFIITRICPCVYGICTGEDKRKMRGVHMVKNAREDIQPIPNSNGAHEYVPSKQEMMQEHPDISQDTLPSVHTQLQYSATADNSYADQSNTPYSSTTQPIGSSTFNPQSQSSRAASVASSYHQSQPLAGDSSYAAAQPSSRAPSAMSQSNRGGASGPPSQHDNSMGAPRIPPSSNYNPPRAMPRSVAASNDDVFVDNNVSQRY